MKYPHTPLLVILAISVSFSGCAITSGLQTYDIPDQGQYKTDQGAEVSVVHLTQSNLPKSDNNLTQNDTVNISALFLLLFRSISLS